MCSTPICRVALATLAIMALLGCKVRPPAKAETQLVTWTKHHVTIGGRNDRNPLQPTPDNIAQGQQLFTSYCMVCHGMDGQNTGVPFATEVSPQVPSLANATVQSYTDGQLHWIIKNGIFPSGMPASDGDFSSEEMWQMVIYIRHLPKAGSLGIPKVYSGSGD